VSSSKYIKPLSASFTLFFLSALILTGCGGKKETPAEKTITYCDTFSTGETLTQIFSRCNIPPNNYFSVIEKLKSICPNVKKIKAGDYYEITVSTNNIIINFSYSPVVEKKYVVELSTSGYNACEIKYKMTRKIFGYSGVIKDNLYNSMVASGLNPSTIMNFADIFESRIDFLTDPREGDRFYVVFEQYFTEQGQEVARERILAGKYVLTLNRIKNTSQTFIAFAFPRDNSYDYYEPSGESLQTQFLKAPLHFRRISSYFSNRRYHPILRYFRPHHGIDYAAPTGTPVSTIGDGKVVFVGRNREYGKQVKIRHNSSYESWYAHLSKYGSAIRANSYVKKGQIIGYVGSTGLATGPHLDFRFKKKGSFVNFLAMRMPPSKKLNKEEMKIFLPLKKEYYRCFAELKVKGKFKKDAPFD